MTITADALISSREETPPPIAQCTISLYLYKIRDEPIWTDNRTRAQYRNGGGPMGKKRKERGRAIKMPNGRAECIHVFPRRERE